MSPVLVVLCALAAAQSPAKPATLDPQLIRVHVKTADSGIAEELEARQQSVRHLEASIGEIKKGKTFAVVPDEELADVVIDVMHRGFTVPTVTFGLGTRNTGSGFRSPASTTRLAQLHVTMVARGAGEPVGITNKNRATDTERGWKSAADDIAKQAEKWIAEHREAILKARRPPAGR